MNIHILIDMNVFECMMFKKWLNVVREVFSGLALVGVFWSLVGPDWSSSLLKMFCGNMIKCLY